MKIKTLSGHLTTTNKTHIKILLQSNLMQARVNRINYLIAPGAEKDFYSVTIIQKDNSIVIGPKISKSKAEFITT